MNKTEKLSKIELVTLKNTLDESTDEFTAKLKAKLVRMIVKKNQEIKKRKQAKITNWIPKGVFYDGTA
jgi:hypothetical protein